MKPRMITNEELADLPSRWENALVDTSKYYQSVLTAYEVDKETYEKGKAEGCFVQVYKNKYYLGL